MSFFRKAKKGELLRDVLDVDTWNRVIHVLETLRVRGGKITRPVDGRPWEISVGSGSGESGERFTGAFWVPMEMEIGDAGGGSTGLRWRGRTVHVEDGVVTKIDDDTAWTFTGILVEPETL